MRVLVACEESQEVCKAFRERGHEAYSNDLQPCSGGHPEWHIQDNAVKAMTLMPWDLVIAHPPCTYLCNSGVRWLDVKNKNHERWDLLEDGIHLFNQFKRKMLYTRVAIENPIPHKYARDGFSNKFGRIIQGIGYYSQKVQPYHFGHGEKKATCFWYSIGMYAVKPLIPTDIVWGREQRLWRLPPSEHRAKLRAKTYPGIARAMAAQWG